MLPDLSTAQWLVLAVTAFMYGFNKTGIVGCAVITTPLLLFFFRSGDVLGITLPLLVIADIGTLLMLRRAANRRHVLLALPWALLGILLGWLFARYTVSLPEAEGDALLRRTIAATLIFLIGFGTLIKFLPAIAARASVDSPEGGDEKPKARTWFAILMGVLGGITTMLANNGGPAWVVYLMSLRLSAREFLGTAAWLFFCQNLAKLPFGVSLGFITWGSVLLAICLIPPLGLGLLTGSAVVRRIPAKLFENLTQAATLICALYILVS